MIKLIEIAQPIAWLLIIVMGYVRYFNGDYLQAICLFLTVISLMLLSAVLDIKEIRERLGKDV